MSNPMDDAIRGAMTHRRIGGHGTVFGTASDEPAPATSFDGGARGPVTQPPSGAEIDEQIREIFNNKPRFGSFGD